MANDLAGYHVVVGVCGGIAAYKICYVVSDLVQRGAIVQVVMTRSGTRFVTPLTFQTLTGRQVFTSLWSSEGYFGQQHIQLTEAADLMLVAPATANMIGKITHGLADDLLSTMVMRADCPVMLAPSMNTRMWENPIVQENVQSLQKRGYLLVGPAEGWLACRTTGAGRLAEPEAILEAVAYQLKSGPPKQERTED